MIKHIERKVYVKLVRLVVMHTCETWKLAIWDTNNLLVLKEKY